MIATLSLLLGVLAQEPPSGPEILKETGVSGGLIVHVGFSGAPGLAAGLAGERNIVEALDREADPAPLRAELDAKGLYGRVTVASYDGRRLPYIDNLVNLAITTEKGTDVSDDEILRVLAPGGVGYRREGGTWRKFRKPRPPEIDD